MILLHITAVQAQEVEVFDTPVANISSMLLLFQLWFILGKLAGPPLEYVSLGNYDCICRYWWSVSQVSIKYILCHSHHRISILIMRTQEWIIYVISMCFTCSLVIAHRYNG